MKHEEVIVGGEYIAKVAGRLTVVRVDTVGVSTRYGRSNRAVRRYEVTNLRTNQKTVFRSAAKFRTAAGVDVKADLLSTLSCGCPTRHCSCP